MRNLSFSDLMELILADYRRNRRSSLPSLLQVRIPHLRLFFGPIPAGRIETKHVRRYQEFRLSQHAAPASINNEVACLRRALRLAVEEGLVTALPLFPTLREDNIRKQFVDIESLRRMAEKCPAHYSNLLVVAFITGWRINSELLTRKRTDVELMGAGTLRLSPGESKDRAGREFKLRPIPALFAAIESQLRYVSRVERDTGRSIPWLFCDPCGWRISSIYRAWNRARNELGYSYIPHDLRRSAARNLRRAGASENDIMALLGWKTRSSFDRYCIVDEISLVEAARKLALLLQVELPANFSSD